MKLDIGKALFIQRKDFRKDLPPSGMRNADGNAAGGEILDISYLFVSFIPEI